MQCGWAHNCVISHCQKPVKACCSPLHDTACNNQRTHQSLGGVSFCFESRFEHVVEFPFTKQFDHVAVGNCLGIVLWKQATWELAVGPTCLCRQIKLIFSTQKLKLSKMRTGTCASQNLQQSPSQPQQRWKVFGACLHKTLSSWYVYFGVSGSSTRG